MHVKSNVLTCMNISCSVQYRILSHVSNKTLLYLILLRPLPPLRHPCYGLYENKIVKRRLLEQD